MMKKCFTKCVYKILNISEWYLLDKYFYKKDLSVSEKCVVLQTQNRSEIINFLTIVYKTTV